MANYGVNINFKVIGQSKLDRALKKTEQLDKKVNILNNRGIKGISSAVKILEKELAIKNKILQADRKILVIRQKQVKTNKANAATQTIPRTGGGFGGGRRGGNFSNAFGSAIIGGGFPLLFGQGPTAAIGGALGGLAGGALGGQFGFALSIAGTTVGQAVDDLAIALARPTENIQKLVDKLNLANKPTGKLALQLEKLGLTTTASNLVLAEFSEITGKTPKELEQTTEKLNQFKDDLTKLGLQFTVLAADVIGPIVDLLNKIPYEKFKKTAKPFLDTILFGPGGVEEVNKELAKIKQKDEVLTDNSFAANRSLARTANDPAKIEAAFIKTRTIENKEIIPFQQPLKIEKDRLNLTKNQIKFKEQEFKLINLKNDLQVLESQKTNEINEDLDLKINKLRLNISLQQTVLDNLREEGFELDELSKKFMDIGASIEKSIVGNLTDAVMGTQSLGQAAVNVLNNLKRKLIEVQIERSVAGIGDKIGGFLGKVFGGGKASGGPVSAGQTYLVGEKGPELLTMGSNRGFITPNNKMGGGGDNTTNIVNVSVDASGSAVSGSSADAEQLGAAIASAVQAQLVKEKRSGGLLAR